MTRKLLRAVLLCAGCWLVALLSAAPAELRAQTGFDRPGGDYSSFAARGGDPAACAERCDRDARCRSWSFAYPTTRGPRATCWLKAEVPARVEDACCVSGVRGGGVIEPRGGEHEFGMDRVGGDYRSFETPAGADAGSCAAACKGEARCRAWTYVRPGYYGSVARCYLKSRVTPPRRKPCCVSGVVR
jgi:PAN domain-containing protein